jgi:C-1 hydroxylase
MTPEENKALIRRFVAEVLNTRSLDRIGEFLAPTYVDHSSDFDDRPPIEALRAGFELWYRSFPDHRIAIQEPVAEEDLVASRSVCQATHQGEYLGVPPSGKRIVFTAHELYRIDAGKIAEHWEIWDEAALLRQLGLITKGAVASDGT